MPIRMVMYYSIGLTTILFFCFLWRLPLVCHSMLTYLSSTRPLEENYDISCFAFIYMYLIRVTWINWISPRLNYQSYTLRTVIIHTWIDGNQRTYTHLCSLHFLLLLFCSQSFIKYYYSNTF